MSEDTTREADAVSDSAAAPKPARKAAKKAAKKAVKTAARKAAPRARKSGDDPAPEQMPLALDPPARKPEPPRDEDNRQPRDPRPQPRGEGSDRDRPAGREDSSDPDSGRFGRVPGGGPVNREDSGESRSDAAPPPQERRQRDDRPERNDRERHDGQRNDGNRNEANRVEGNRGDANRERRKRRRKRRRGDNRGENRVENRGDTRGEGSSQGEPRDASRDRDRDRNDSEPRDVAEVLSGPKVEVQGLFELAPKGFGFLRVPDKNFEQARDDVFVSPDLVRKCGLRLGVWIHGLAQEGARGPQLVEITSVNDLSPDEAKKLPAFEELKAINPNKRIAFETVQDRHTTRVVDLMSPVGRGQRGLIVSPPRSGKTTLLLHIAEAVRELHDETLHLMILLVDERPEEVTEFRRCLPGVEVYASSNDEHARNHTRIAEICIERAKRLVEGGKHVFLLMDSITRLARAYNGGMRTQGRGIGSGGIMVGALETPRRLFAAARNTREAGSLTILATALVQTNSRADDAIFQEFKGTGNMELVLDRKIAENYIYPAVDIFKSGTRREELLLPEHTLHKIHMIRRGLSGHRPVEAMERLLYFIKKFPNNPQMLLEIKG